jgi:hypothetical protein
MACPFAHLPPLSGAVDFPEAPWQGVFFYRFVRMPVWGSEFSVCSCADFHPKRFSNQCLMFMPPYFYPDDASDSNALYFHAPHR